MTSAPSTARREPLQVNGLVDPDGQVDGNPRQAFVSRLRTCRERRGLTLDEIAARTKIRRSYLASLESNDLSTWPGGIYRRAYIRSYALALGLAPDQVVEEFSATFLEFGDHGNGHPQAAGGSASLRLTLVQDHGARRRSWIWRLAFVMLEAAVLVSAGVALGSGTGNVLAGLVPLVYYPLCLATAGSTIATRTAGACAIGSPHRASRSR